MTDFKVDHEAKNRYLETNIERDITYFNASGYSKEKEDFFKMKN